MIYVPEQLQPQIHLEMSNIGQHHCAISFMLQIPTNKTKDDISSCQHVGMYDVVAGCAGGQRQGYGLATLLAMNSPIYFSIGANTRMFSSAGGFVFLDVFPAV